MGKKWGHSSFRCNNQKTVALTRAECDCYNEMRNVPISWRQMKTSGLSLAIAVFAFGASTIYLAVQLSEERAHSEQLVDATRALNARIAELEKVRDEGRFAMNGTFGSTNLPPGAMQNAQLPSPSVAVEGEPDAQAAVTANGPFMPPQSEAFQKMMRAQMRSYNKQMYSDVGAQLGLTREEVNKLIDLLTDVDRKSVV